MSNYEINYIIKQQQKGFFIFNMTQNI